MASRFSVDRGGSTTFGAGYQSLTGGKNQKSTGEMLSERGGHNDDQTSSAEKVLQAKAFNEIVEALIGAGYFRARVVTLSDFDKAVGGLCWCITSSGVQVDVDILFEENSSIGAKVQLCEKIIHVMRAMRCPYPLQANQIQGSDWANVLPVIQWLVKKFVGFRQETQGKLRKYAQQQFGKNYLLPHEGGFVEQGTEGSSEGLLGALRRYGPQRKFRLTDATVRRNTEESRVHAALLEYGETMRARRGLAGSDGAPQGAKAGGGEGTAAGGAGGRGGGGVVVGAADGVDERQLSAFERKLLNEAKKAAAAEAALAKEMLTEEGELLEGMQSLDGNQAAGASKRRVGNIMSLGTDDIAAAAAKYEEDVEETRRRLLEQDGLGGAGGLAMGAYKRRKAALEQQRDALAPQVEEAQKQRKAAEAELAKVQATFRAQQARIAELKGMLEGDGKIAKAERAAEASGQMGDLLKLKALVLKNEKLKKQIELFKKSVKEQRDAMQAELAELEAAEKERERLAAAGQEDEETARYNQIEVMHTKVMTKYDRLRQLLAERNLTLSSGMRAIDDIPTRTELIQYERRFSELYQQVALKLGENKKYFEMYNTLDERKRMLEKEVTLVNSITENFDEAMRTKASKEQFLTQFEGIIKGVEDSLAAKRGVLKQKEERLAGVNRMHQALVDEQRRYFKAVKEFQEECNRNELYANKLAELQRAQGVTPE